MLIFNESFYILYDYSNYECSYEDADSVSCAVNITAYSGDYEWEMLLSKAYKFYNQKDYSGAFLMLFVSFESFIESVNYELRNNLKKIYSGY